MSDPYRELFVETPASEPRTVDDLFEEIAKHPRPKPIRVYMHPATFRRIVMYTNARVDGDAGSESICLHTPYGVARLHPDPDIGDRDYLHFEEAPMSELAALSAESGLTDLERIQLHCIARRRLNQPQPMYRISDTEFDLHVFRYPAVIEHDARGAHVYYSFGALMAAIYSGGIGGLEVIEP